MFSLNRTISLSVFPRDPVAALDAAVDYVKVGQTFAADMEFTIVIELHIFITTVLVCCNKSLIRRFTLMERPILIY